MRLHTLDERVSGPDVHTSPLAAGIARLGRLPERDTRHRVQLRDAAKCSATGREPTTCAEITSKCVRTLDT